MFTKQADPSLRIGGGLCVALPVFFTEWLLLVADGPWWLPHPAGTPVASWAWALLASGMLGALVVHAVAVSMPPLMDWQEFWTQYWAIGQFVLYAGCFVFAFSLEWYGLRQFLALGIPMAVLACHARAVIKARS